MQYPLRQSFASFYMEFLFMLLCLFGCIGCVVTGFSLPHHPTALYPAILVIALVFSLLSTDIPAAAKRARLLSFVLKVVLFVFLAFIVPGRIAAVADGLFYAAVYIFRSLCWGFSGLSMPEFLEDYEETILRAAADPEASLLIAAAITEALVWITVYLALIFYFFRSISPKLGALLPIPFFVLCFLVIEATIPDAWAIGCLLLFWILTLLSASTQSLNPSAAAAQITALLLPVVLLLSGVYIAFPKENTVRDRIETAYDRTLHAVSDIASAFGDGRSGLSQWLTVSAEGNDIAFSSLGERRYSGRTVMHVESDTPGVYYLRENTYNVYTADGWSYTAPEIGLTAQDEEKLSRASAAILQASGAPKLELSLSGARSSLLFTPYYTKEVSVPYAVNHDRNLTNTDRESAYSFDAYRFSGVFSDLQTTSSQSLAQSYMLLAKYGDAVNTLYTQINRDTANILRALLRENDIVTRPPAQDTLWETVSDITTFVRSSATYSLDAPVPPTDRDFVVWFLSEAELGYCTYFATAEVMLLRACGIPARLAAGFLVNITQANRDTLIRDSSAHAWAEVFDARLGWIPIEATPPDLRLGDGDGPVSPIPEEPVTPIEETTDPSETESATVDGTVTPDTPPTPDAPDVSTAPPGPPAHPGDGDGTGIGSGDGSGGSAQRHSAKAVLRILIWIIGILCVAALLLFCAVRYRAFRLARIYSGIAPADTDEKTAMPKTNAAALYLYRRCHSAAMLLHTEDTTALDALAEKAKFSQYTLTPNEVAVFRSTYDALVSRLREQDRSRPVDRFLHQWIDVYY